MEEEDGCGVGDSATNYRKHLQESFSGYDTDNDGVIRFDEVVAAWKRCLVELNQTVDEERVRMEATKFMKELDKNSDDLVSFDEYVAYFENLCANSVEQNSFQKYMDSNSPA